MFRMSIGDESFCGNDYDLKFFLFEKGGTLSMLQSKIETGSSKERITSKTKFLILDETFVVDYFHDKCSQLPQFTISKKIILVKRI